MLTMLVGGVPLAGSDIILVIVVDVVEVPGG